LSFQAISSICTKALERQGQTVPQARKVPEPPPQGQDMNPRLKKLIGTMVMVLFVLFYVLVVVAIAPRILNDASKSVELAFYVIAGLAWTLPLLPLIRWMEKKKG